MFTSVPEINEAIALGENAFISKYGFPKPLKNSLLVAYCRSGKRAADAVSILQTSGYTRWGFMTIAFLCLNIIL